MSKEKERRGFRRRKIKRHEEASAKQRVLEKQRRKSGREFRGMKREGTKTVNREKRKRQTEKEKEKIGGG